MADYTADQMVGSVGTLANERTGTASADTVQAGSFVLWRNTGAGTHVVTITTNNLVGDLAIADRTITLTTGQVKGGRVPAEWGDANGRCAVAIDATAAEVKYYVLGTSGL
jgi:hypothetical protein